MNYGYLRVSTDRQSLYGQKNEIKKFCIKEGIKIDRWVEEKVSGTCDVDGRKLGSLLEKLQKGDMIICSELSRLGRTLFMIMEILNICLTRDCKVWSIKDGYRLGEDIQSKVLAFAFGLAAEIERNLISQRTREALAWKRAAGVRLGRPSGVRNKSYKLDPMRRDITTMLSCGLTRHEIALRCHVSEKTLRRYLTTIKEV